MADQYKVYDSSGKSLSGRTPVDRDTARRIFTEAQRQAGRGEGPTMIRVGSDKAGPKESSDSE